MAPNIPKLVKKIYLPIQNAEVHHNEPAENPRRNLESSQRKTTYNIQQGNHILKKCQPTFKHDKSYKTVGHIFHVLKGIETINPEFHIQ